jgi:hypothetical protein
LAGCLFAKTMADLIVFLVVGGWQLGKTMADSNVLPVVAGDCRWLAAGFGWPRDWMACWLLGKTISSFCWWLLVGFGWLAVCKSDDEKPSRC